MKTVSHSAVRTYELFIDGQWVPARSRRTFGRRSPATGELAGTYAEGGPEDVELAARAARRAFDEGEWSRSAKLRSAVLKRFAQLMLDHREKLASIMSLEMGKPIQAALDEVQYVASTVDFHAGWAMDLSGEVIDHQTPTAIGLNVREPVGVVGAITPWNFPLLIPCWKIAPAFAAGCTVVIKPSHLAPGVALEVASLLTEAGAPAGVYNVVTSEADNGALVGEALCDSSLIDKITFTGSTETGRKVMARAASTIKRITLELGGKSPNVVFADADLDEAANFIHVGYSYNSGQACDCGSRLIVQDSVRDRLVEKLLERAKAEKVGHPFDASTTLGPLVSERQLSKVLYYVNKGKERGAKVLCGGQQLTGDPYDRGYFVAPTIFTDVRPDYEIAREEIFGPVLSILTFQNLAEGMRLANETIYGLSAGVWSKDIDTALKMAKAIRAGRVYVNNYLGAGLAPTPFGGFRQSGIGRESGKEGIYAFLETKSIHIKLH